MADTTTTNYDWVKPEVGASPTTWGAKLNSDLDAIDAQVFNNQTAIGAITGQLTPAPANLNVSSVPATPTPATVTFLNSAAPTGQQSRWAWTEDTTPETGGNAGSNFNLRSFSDGGAPLATPITVNRGTGAVGLIGTNTNNAAAAGQIGEVISANVVAASAAALTSAVGATVASIALTAGDWDVSGEVWFSGTGTPNSLHGGINAVAATLPTDSSGATARHSVNTPFNAGAINVLPLRSCRVLLAAPATYYLVAEAGFTGAVSAYGNIVARRRR